MSKEKELFVDKEPTLYSHRSKHMSKSPTGTIKPFVCVCVCTTVRLRPQNMADIKKMKSVGICTVKGIQMTTRKALCNIKGLSEAKVEKIKEAAGKMLVKIVIEVHLYSMATTALKNLINECYVDRLPEYWFPDSL